MNTNNRSLNKNLIIENILVSTSITLFDAVANFVPLISNAIAASGLS
jgi:hypothetical protein